MRYNLSVRNSLMMLPDPYCAGRGLGRDLIVRSRAVLESFLLQNCDSDRRYVHIFIGMGLQTQQTWYSKRTVDLFLLMTLQVRFFFFFFSWGIPPLQSDGSLSCDHGLYYAS